MICLNCEMASVRVVQKTRGNPDDDLRTKTKTEKVALRAGDHCICHIANLLKVTIVLRICNMLGIELYFSSIDDNQIWSRNLP